MGIIRWLEAKTVAHFIDKATDDIDGAVEKVGKNIDELTAQRYGEERSEIIQERLILVILAFSKKLCQYLAKDWSEKKWEDWEDKIK